MLSQGAVIACPIASNIWRRNFSTWHNFLHGHCPFLNCHYQICAIACRVASHAFVLYQIFWLCNRNEEEGKIKMRIMLCCHKILHCCIQYKEVRWGEEEMRWESAFTFQNNAESCDALVHQICFPKIFFLKKTFKSFSKQHRNVTLKGWIPP